MNTERLLKLAEHLESGKLGHVEFDFSAWNKTANGGDEVDGCGFSGCAIGECPVVFPDDWCFNEGVPCLVGIDAGPFDGPRLSGQNFFDLDRSEFNHLFLPGCQLPNNYGGEYLRPTATRQQVASNIRAFVAEKLEGK
jgi:hypothetical protein